MAQFYSNENFPYPVVEQLRYLGHDVLTVKEVHNDNKSIPDDEVLAFAIRSGRAILTINRKDFVALHKRYQRQKQSHCGVVVCTKDEDFKRQAKNIHAAVTAKITLDNILLKVYKG